MEWLALSFVTWVGRGRQRWVCPLGDRPGSCFSCLSWVLSEVTTEAKQAAEPMLGEGSLPRVAQAVVTADGSELTPAKYDSLV